MSCTTCGRENPPHLTFCQECGQRLGPRIAPPTPPIGLPGQELASRVPTQSAALPVIAAPVAPPTTSERRCRVCDTLNAAGLRYCTSCGSALETPPDASAPAPVPAPAPIPAPAPAPIPAAALVPAAAPIAPARVVDLGATTPASVEPQRSCARCRGPVDSGAQFCKFCGASLASERSPPPFAEARPGNGVAPHPAPLQERRPITSPLAWPGAPSAPGPVARPLPPPVATPPPPVATPPPLVATPPPPVAGAQAVVARARVHGRLVVIAKSGADGPSYPIGDTLDIGRLEGHVVVAEDPYLSPRHVRISAEGAKLVLRDLASTNGVFLRLASARAMRGMRGVRGMQDSSGREDAGSGGEVAVPLEDQDLILVGQQVLRFEVVKDGEGGLGPAVEHGTLLFGSPAGPRYARLGQRTVEGVTRDVYYLRKMETVFGRESGDVVFTEDPFLSRRHAAIRVLGRDWSPAPHGRNIAPADARFALVDLGSSNGTFLRIRTEIDLVRGDHFRAGQQLFRVDLEGGQAA